ncbi:MAG TPA: VOC family protein [Roseiarcus sp.]|nr:VOC family protein [Roseiarcus sp.]
MALPHFVLLYVDEPQASSAFYARLLNRQPLDSSPNFVMFELSPDLRLGLWARRDVEPAPSDASATGELAMAVGTQEEVEALCADQRRKGAAILQEPVTKDFGRTFLAADPDGHRLRVFCPAA